MCRLRTMRAGKLGRQPECDPCSAEAESLDAIVAFCGIDEKTAGKPTVLGTAPDDNDGIRIVIFEPAGKQAWALRARPTRREQC